MAQLKAGTTVAEALVLTTGNHNNTGDPHDQYATKAAHYDSATIDALLAANSANDIAASAGAAAAALVSETNAAISETNAALSASQAATSASNADTSATAAALSESNAAASEVATTADAIATAADVVLTNADAIAIAADRVQTGLDVIATAADVVITNAAAVTSTTKASESSASALASENSRSYSEEWANKPEDVLVSSAAGGDLVDDYSALHYRNKTVQALADVYKKDNIVGTVSETAGVPTGAIIERGSNANGEYVKYADGTMICTKVIVYNTTINLPSNGIFYATAAPSTNMAATFIDKPNITITITGIAGNVWTGVAGVHTATVFPACYALSDTSRTGSDHDYLYTAIGRWF